MKRVISLFSIFSASLLIVSSSCNKDEDEPLPPIGGYNSSNDVAKANNVVHFTFDGTNTDRIGNLAPTTAVGATFTTGAKGQGLTLTNGYILYPAIAALGNANALNSSSITGWVKISNNGVSPTCLFALTQSTSEQTDWNTGPLMMMAENGKAITTDDTLVLKGIFSTWVGVDRLGGDNINDYGVRETDFKTVKTGGTWVHVVVRYNGATSEIDIYANGIRVSNNQFRKRTRGNPPADMGVITTKPPVQAVIGGFPNSNTGFAKSIAQDWQKNMTGSLDEFRVYTKSLTDDEILALYQLEKAGR